MPNENGDGLILKCKPVGRQGAAMVTATLAGEPIAVESFNLAKPKARASFAKSVTDGRAGIDAATVESELLKLAADAAAQGNKGDKPDQGEPDRLAAMPESIRTEARAILESPDLLKRIVEDIGTLGVAGERELAATLYLVGTSRLLPKPLAAIVQGPTSSGKSYLEDKVASLFPPEAVIHATQMTPQALYHMKPGSLRHQFVVAGERSRNENDDTAEATRALREMLGSGRLTKLMPTKVGGEIRTVTIDQEGPIAYVESTTLSNIFDEDRNRCVLLTTDEQQAQTQRIIHKLPESYSGVAPQAASGRIIDQHHALQRMLQQYTVVVPFAARLGGLVAPDRVEARRAFPQLVSMIQASALLHQQQRKVDAEGRLVAEADDYRLARHLLLNPLGRLLGGRLSDPAARFYGRLRERVAVEQTFTSREAKRDETASRRSVYGWINELHDAGRVELVEVSRGNKPSTWRLAEAETDRPVLPTEAQVFDSGE